MRLRLGGGGGQPKGLELHPQDLKEPSKGFRQGNMI